MFSSLNDHISNDIDIGIHIDPPDSPPPNPDPEDDVPDSNRNFLTVHRRCELCKQRKVCCQLLGKCSATINATTQLVPVAASSNFGFLSDDSELPRNDKSCDSFSGSGSLSVILGSHRDRVLDAASLEYR